MVKERKFYDLLVVTPLATPEQIRSAYMKAAKKYHPDRNPNADPEKFQMIAKAYQVLSDETQRAVYDEFGEQGLNGGATGATGGGGPSSSSSSSNPQSSTTTKQSNQVPVNRGRKEEDIIVEVKVSLEDFYNGKKIEGIKAAGESHDVYVDRGMGDGQRVVLRNKANNSIDKTVEHGDLIFVLKQTPHNIFKRDGPHLFIDHTISLQEALCGFQFQIKHLDNHLTNIKCNRGQHVVSPNSIFKAHGEGMPLFRSPFHKGHLYIKFSIEFPKTGSLNDSVLNQLSLLLPGPPPIVSVPIRRNNNNSSTTSNSSNLSDDVEDVAIENFDEVEFEKLKRDLQDRINSVDFS